LKQGQLSPAQILPFAHFYSLPFGFIPKHSIENKFIFTRLYIDCWFKMKGKGRNREQPKALDPATAIVKTHHH
jgi:hypothetical protein